MRRRLEAIGLRAINNVVDVTNYVMFEMGQPLHAFDFEKLTERRIVVRNAKSGETLTSIDGHERKLTPDMLVIADAKVPVALAGVMGGRDSEVSDATVNVLLESARFDPLSVRTTSRRLALKSDSSYRFERGIDPTLPLRASLRAAQLIVETGGGELLSGVVQAGVESAPPKTVTLRLSRLAALLGIEIPSASAIDALTRLGLPAKLNGDRIDVSVPSRRADLNIEADLIEEVARINGYDKIPIRDQILIRLVPPEPNRQILDTIRSSLVGSGYFEAITVTFVTDQLARDFVPESAALPRTDPMVRKADGQLRPSLLPGLLEALRRNESAGNGGVALYEVGSTFTLDANSKVDERRRLALADAGQGLRELRGVIESLLTGLDSSRDIRVKPTSQAGYDPGACGVIEWGGKPVGYLGRIAPGVAATIDLRAAPVAAELDLPALIDGAQLVPQLRALPRYPAVQRDLSFVISESLRFEEINRVISQLNLPDLEGVEFVGSYRGKPLEKGQKSVTVSLVFRSSNQTLTSESVDASVKRVVDAAVKVGATLRG